MPKILKGGMFGGAGGQWNAAAIAPNHMTPLGNLPGSPRTEWHRRRRFKKGMATDGKEQESESRRAIRQLRDVIETLQDDIHHEKAELRAERKAKYSKDERKEVNKRKEAEYGTKEYFAVPSLHSYPLTKNGKPSEERTRSAWGYIHHPDNAAKLGKEAASAESRIRSFAKKHFPGMALESSEAHKALVEHCLASLPPEPLDQAIRVIYGKAPIREAIKNLHDYLEETANTRNHDVLTKRAHLTAVLDRLVEAADRNGQY